MELRQLRYFTAVARHGHFRSAAAVLHLTQPTLSEQIQLLEQELGVRLFDRDRQVVQLTPAGLALLPHAETVLQEIERTRATMRNLARHEEQRVVMGTVPTLTPRRSLLHWPGSTIGIPASISFCAKVGKITSSRYCAALR